MKIFDMILEGFALGTIYMMGVAVTMQLFFEEYLPIPPLPLLIIIIICTTLGIITRNQMYTKRR